MRVGYCVWIVRSLSSVLRVHCNYVSFKRIDRVCNICAANLFASKIGKDKETNGYDCE